MARFYRLDVKPPALLAAHSVQDRHLPMWPDQHTSAPTSDVRGNFAPTKSR